VVYEDGVFKPLEPVNLSEGTRVPLNLAKGEVLKTYRGRFGKLDETLLREFELEAVQATFS
jgi:predicted DNA-binding antitoxin AbrB/MazE fold protein